MAIIHKMFQKGINKNFSIDLPIALSHDFKFSLDPADLSVLLDLAFVKYGCLQVYLHQFFQDI